MVVVDQPAGQADADLDEATLQAELEYARTLGFDVDRVVRSAPLPGN